MQSTLAGFIKKSRVKGILHNSIVCSHGEFDAAGNDLITNNHLDLNIVVEEDLFKHQPSSMEEDSSQHQPTYNLIAHK